MKLSALALWITISRFFLVKTQIGKKGIDLSDVEKVWCPLLLTNAALTHSLQARILSV